MAKCFSSEPQRRYPLRNSSRLNISYKLLCDAALAPEKESCDNSKLSVQDKTLLRKRKRFSSNVSSKSSGSKSAASPKQRERLTKLSSKSFASNSSNQYTIQLRPRSSLGFSLRVKDRNDDSKLDFSASDPPISPRCCNGDSGPIKTYETRSFFKKETKENISSVKRVDFDKSASFESFSTSHSEFLPSSESDASDYEFHCRRTQSSLRRSKKLRSNKSYVEFDNFEDTERRLLHCAGALPCREDDFSEILCFIEKRLKSNISGCMYICGVPGTGKTATVEAVIRTLCEHRERLPDFRVAMVNGMKLKNPNHVYSRIWECITHQKLSDEKSLAALDEMFKESNKNQIPVILVIDELDLLWNRKQSIFYNLFDWPSRAGSRLIVIAIANTMDMPERMLKNKIKSRLGLSRKCFYPYTSKNLELILVHKLKSIENKFDPDAVLLVAKKVAAVCGDVRRAVDLCERAFQVAEREKFSHVTIFHVDKAIQDIFSSPVSLRIQASSKHEKLFMQSLCQELDYSGSQETTFSAVLERHTGLSRQLGSAPPNPSELLMIALSLRNSGIIFLDSCSNALLQRIRLAMPLNELSMNLKIVE